MKIRHAFLLAFFVICVIPGFGQEQPFYFVMLADTQLGMYENNRDFVRETANYEFAVATVNRLKPGFVIVLGDLVNKEGDAGTDPRISANNAKDRSGYPSLSMWRATMMSATNRLRKRWRHTGKSSAATITPFAPAPSTASCWIPTLIQCAQEGRSRNIRNSFRGLKRNWKRRRVRMRATSLFFSIIPISSSEAQEPEAVYEICRWSAGKPIAGAIASI